MDLDGLVTRHLEEWLGRWPPRARLDVVGCRKRVEPGWDGAVRPVVGVATPDAAVISVPPWAAAGARDLGSDWRSDGYAGRLGRLVGVDRAVLGVGVFRWASDVADGDDPGTWVPRTHPHLPEWLRPFNGDVLAVFDADGSYLAGVGLKRHDRWGVEISVGTTAHARGRGLARRLVAQAARAIILEGSVPTYLHDPANAASARVAEAAGFPDRGWLILGLWPGPDPDGGGASA